VGVAVIVYSLRLPEIHLILTELTKALKIFIIALSGLCNLETKAMTIQVSIGQVKRDISELVNRVAYQGERVVLTSRGRPKAVLVSMEDYARLTQAEAGLNSRVTWLAGAQELSRQIRERRGGYDLDVDALIEADQDERDESDA
jgi:prevent-host-death family protein